MNSRYIVALLIMSPLVAAGASDWFNNFQQTEYYKPAIGVAIAVPLAGMAYWYSNRIERLRFEEKRNQFFAIVTNKYPLVSNPTPAELDEIVQGMGSYTFMISALEADLHTMDTREYLQRHMEYPKRNAHKLVAKNMQTLLNTLRTSAGYYKECLQPAYKLLSLFWEYKYSGLINAPSGRIDERTLAPSVIEFFGEHGDPTSDDSDLRMPYHNLMYVVSNTMHTFETGVIFAEKLKDTDLGHLFRLRIKQLKHFRAWLSARPEYKAESREIEEQQRERDARKRRDAEAKQKAEEAQREQERLQLERRRLDQESERIRLKRLGLLKASIDGKTYAFTDI